MGRTIWLPWSAPRSHAMWFRYQIILVFSYSVKGTIDGDRRWRTILSPRLHISTNGLMECTALLRIQRRQCEELNDSYLRSAGKSGVCFGRSFEWLILA